MEEGGADFAGPQGPGPCPGVLGSSGRGRISSGCGKSSWGLCEDEQKFGKPWRRLGLGSGWEGKRPEPGYCWGDTGWGWGQELGDCWI